MRQYQRDTPKKLLQGIVAKKIFIDHYNYVIKYDRYDSSGSPENSLKSLQKVDWEYPVPCVRDNSYFYILKWLDWIKNDKWVHKNDVGDIPRGFEYL